MTFHIDIHISRHFLHIYYNHILEFRYVPMIISAPAWPEIEMAIPDTKSNTVPVRTEFSTAAARATSPNISRHVQIYCPERAAP